MFEVIFVSGWGVFIQKYQLNKLEDRMYKLERGQNVKNLAEETSVELESGISMDAELIGEFITQWVADVMAERKKNSMKRKFKTGELWEGLNFGRVHKKRNEGRWTHLQEKEKIHDDNNNNDYKV